MGRRLGPQRRRLARPEGAGRPAIGEAPRRRWRFGAAAAAFAFLLGAAAGCGEPGSEEEREAILGAVDSARDAVVEGRPEEACAMLTRHGRERARNFGPAYEDTKTCEAAVRYEIESDRDPRVDARDVEDLAGARFEVVEVDDDRARVRISAPSGAEVAIELRREAGRWRVHDSDAVPEGD